MRPKLSVVFVNHQSTHLLGRALGSLAAAEPELGCETIVVDNASPDRGGLSGVCARFGARLLLLNRNRGYGAAANRGLSLVSGEHAAVANPDVEFPAGSVSRLVRSLDENPGAGAVGPQLVYADGRLQPSARRFPRLRYALAGRRSLLVRLLPGYRAARDFLYDGLEAKSGPVPVEAVIGTFVVFRREALQAVGGFDERYFLFAEDMDICRRMSRLGWLSMVETRSHVVHLYGGTRRLVRRFSEYHRLKALARFLADGRTTPGAALVGTAAAGYYFLLEAGGLVGLWEREYSWRSKVAS